jgi:hypothetical protein
MFFSLLTVHRQFPIQDINVLGDAEYLVLHESISSSGKYGICFGDDVTSKGCARCSGETQRGFAALVEKRIGY